MSSINERPLYADTPLALLATPAFLTGKVSGLLHSMKV